VIEPEDGPVPDDIMGIEGRRGRRSRRLRGALPMRAVVPNAITTAALCSGLTGIRFAISGDFDKAILAVILAGLLDGIDGRAARLLKAQTRFGAELDSLADAISFGVAPALIVYLWTLHHLPSLGWIAALAYAICCVLRLARFNSRLDSLDQPHKQAGFLTGVPAPLGAGLAFLPIYLWRSTDWNAAFAQPLVVSAWMVFVAFLMISSLPTLSWSRLRPPREYQIAALALVGLTVAALLTEPWSTLAVVSLIYLVLLPIGLLAYRSVRQRTPSTAPAGTASGDANEPQT